MSVFVSVINGDLARVTWADARLVRPYVIRCVRRVDVGLSSASEPACDVQISWSEAIRGADSSAISTLLDRKTLKGHDAETAWVGAVRVGRCLGTLGC
jgi:hypothetical protein